MLLSFSAPADNSYRHIVSLCLTVHFICLFGLKSGIKLGRSRKLSPFGSVPHSAPHPYPPITSLRCAPRLVDVIMLHLSRGQTFSSLRHLEHIHLPEVTEKPPLSLPPPHPRAQAPPSVQAPPPRPAGRRGSGLQGGAADSRREKKGPEDEACRVVASSPASLATVRGGVPGEARFGVARGRAFKAQLCSAFSS